MGWCCVFAFLLLSLGGAYWWDALFYGLIDLIAWVLRKGRTPRR